MLNEHFAGTYMAYLSFTAQGEAWDADAFVARVEQALAAQERQLRDDELPELTVAFAPLRDNLRR